MSKSTDPNIIIYKLLVNIGKLSCIIVLIPSAMNHEGIAISKISNSIFFSDFVIFFIS